MKNRVNETLRRREQLASLKARKPAPKQADNGDESAMTMSAELHEGTAACRRGYSWTGNPASYKTFKDALLSLSHLGFRAVLAGTRAAPVV